MGKLGLACVGAWVVHGIGACVVVPGLVKQDLSIGSGLVGGGEEVFGVVS